MDTKKEKSNNASKATKRLSEGQFKKKKKKKKKKNWKTKSYLDTKKEKAKKTPNILIFFIFIYTIFFFQKCFFYHCSILLSKIKCTY